MWQLSSYLWRSILKGYDIFGRFGSNESGIIWYSTIDRQLSLKIHFFILTNSDARITPFSSISNNRRKLSTRFRHKPNPYRENLTIQANHPFKWMLGLKLKSDRRSALKRQEGEVLANENAHHSRAEEEHKKQIVRNFAIRILNHFPIIDGSYYRP